MYLYPIIDVLVLCLLEVESGNLRIFKWKIDVGGDLLAFVSDAQEGVWERCDECGDPMFYSYGQWDRLGYAHFNDGAFFCGPCDRKICEEEFGDSADFVGEFEPFDYHEEEIIEF